MRRTLLLSLAVLAGLFILAAFAFAIFQPIKVLPRIRLAPGFSLVDQENQRLTNEDLRGKLVLYSFTYTRCQPPCSQPVLAIQSIQDRLDEIDLGGIPLAFVTISFDPQYDTSQVMSGYASSLGADPQLWRFATSENPVTLKTLLGEGFRVYYQPDEDGGFNFDPAFILVDGFGIIRAEYRLGTPESHVERILTHLEVLVEEIQKSEGAARLAYEAAHLFMCYAP